eukprot:g1822.t1
MVFSGIVECSGKVLKCEFNSSLSLWDGSKGEGWVLEVEVPSSVVKGTVLGISIAVNGVCLTVVSFTSTSFTFNFTKETARCTNLKNCKPGDPCNVERSLQVQTTDEGNGDVVVRNSGHYVQGHVDCTGPVLDKWNEGASLWVKISYANYNQHSSASGNSMSAGKRPVVPKGYVAIDGTSLTVCEVNTKEQWFTVMLIPHTQAIITLPHRKINDHVNLEFDVMAKYHDNTSWLSSKKLGLLVAGSLAGGLLLGAAVVYFLLPPRREKDE